MGEAPGKIAMILKQISNERFNGPDDQAGAHRCGRRHA
jgi:hypothetical protein